MANSKISALTSATTPLAGTETLPVVQSSTTKQVSVANLTAGRAVSASSLSASTGNVEVASTSGYLRVNGQFGGTANGNILVNIGTGQNLILAETASNIYTVGYGAAGGVPTKITDFEVSTKDTRSYGNFVPNTAAKGVNFTANTPAAGMTSQLLNWYEEGTWTPALAFGGASTGITYNAQAGTYTRIGRLVHCFARLSLSSKGSASGSATITGLPFTSASGDASNGGVMTPSLYSNMASLTGLSGYVGASSTTINLGNDGATDTNGINATNFTNSTTIYFSVQYYV